MFLDGSLKLMETRISQAVATCKTTYTSCPWILHYPAGVSACKGHWHWGRKTCPKTPETASSPKPTEHYWADRWRSYLLRTTRLPSHENSTSDTLTREVSGMPLFSFLSHYILAALTVILSLGSFPLLSVTSCGLRVTPGLTWHPDKSRRQDRKTYKDRAETEKILTSFDPFAAEVRLFLS